MADSIYTAVAASTGDGRTGRRAATDNDALDLTLAVPTAADDRALRRDRTRDPAHIDACRRSLITEIATGSTSRSTRSVTTSRQVFPARSAQFFHGNASNGRPGPRTRLNV